MFVRFSLTRAFILPFVLLASINVAFGQGYYYNSQQFGLQSTMLGGAVTSGNEDLSMAYYNPAALYMAKQKVDFSLLQPEFSKYGFGNFFGEQIKSSNIDIDYAPKLASFRLKLNKKINLIIITINQNSWNNKIGLQNVKDGENTKTERVFKYRHSGKDRWIGTGWSFQLNKNLSLGVSQFLSTARYYYDYTIHSNQFDNSTNKTINYFSDEVSSSYSSKYASVTKLGLQLRYGNNNIGLVIKTPHYLPIATGGSYERQIIDNNDEDSTIKSSIDYRLNPNIKTPWELNFGYSIRLKSGSKFWVNVSHNTGISQYSLAKIETAINEQLFWKNGSKPVTNYSFGFSGNIGTKLKVISSLRTNYLAYENKAQAENEHRIFVIDDDRYHLSMGVNFNFKNNSLLVGADMGFTKIADRISFNNFFPNIGKLNTNASDFKNRKISFMFTYGFLFERKTYDFLFKNKNNPID